MLEPNFPIILHVWVVLRIVVEADAVWLSAHRWTFATVSDLAQWVTFEFAGLVHFHVLYIACYLCLLSGAPVSRGLSVLLVSVSHDYLVLAKDRREH